MELAQDLAGTLRVARRNAPHTAAVVSVGEGISATYAELDDRSDRLAHGLLALGLKPGDRIALWLQTSLRHVLLYLAAAKAGLVVVPVNERYRAQEVEHVLVDSGARALVFGSFAAETVERLGLLGSLLLLSVDESILDATSLANLEAQSSLPGPPDVRRLPEDPFMLGYTSGTTGRAKGAVLTHRGVLNIARTNSLGYRLPLGSVGVYTAAMTYTATVPAFILTHFYLSGTVVLSPHREPDVVTDLIERHRADYTHIPPPLVDDYAAEFGRRPSALASLSSVLQGAGKVPADRLAALNEVLGGRLTLGWGMTENSGGLATVTTPADMRRALDGDHGVLDSVGRAVPGTEVEAHGADGNAVPTDGESQGELMIRSTSLMAGYWNSESAQPEPLSGDWYATGDIGVIDADGLVHLRERRQDLIVSGGMNIYPAEVEQALRTLPQIADCAVVGVPDPRWGQAVAALVVTRPGEKLSADQVIAHCRDRLASFKKPTHVRFAPAVPRTLSGKTQRFEVARSFAELSHDQ